MGDHIAVMKEGAGLLSYAMPQEILKSRPTSRGDFGERPRPCRSWRAPASASRRSARLWGSCHGRDGRHPARRARRPLLVNGRD